MKCAHCGYDGPDLQASFYAAVATLIVLFFIYASRVMEDHGKRSQSTGIAPEAS